uniref:Uncharacterized protein n=1 Tax=Oryza brachyantha TaxID=4533 RepID=J3KY94_ORYBR
MALLRALRGKLRLRGNSSQSCTGSLLLPVSAVAMLLCATDLSRVVVFFLPLVASTSMCCAAAYLLVPAPPESDGGGGAAAKEVVLVRGGRAEVGVLQKRVSFITASAPHKSHLGAGRNAEASGFIPPETAAPTLRTK